MWGSFKPRRQRGRPSAQHRKRKFRRRQNHRPTSQNITSFPYHPLGFPQHPQSTQGGRASRVPFRVKAASVTVARPWEHHGMAGAIGSIIVQQRAVRETRPRQHCVGVVINLGRGEGWGMGRYDLHAGYYQPLILEVSDGYLLVWVGKVGQDRAGARGGSMGEGR